MSIKEKVKKIIENKLLMRLLWVICLVLFVVLFVRYNKYSTSRKFYNKGVDLFREGNYERAEENFKYSTLYKSPKSLECKERINYALSITTKITEDSVTDENLDECIARLEEASDILTAHDCAHKSDSKGHNRKAQKLKEEIDAYIEYLKEEHPPKEEPQDENKDDKNGGNDDEQKKREEEQKKIEDQKKQREQDKLKEKFEKIEQQGLNERNSNLDLYETWAKENYSYTTNRNW